MTNFEVRIGSIVRDRQTEELLTVVEQNDTGVVLQLNGSDKTFGTAAINEGDHCLILGHYWEPVEN